MAEFKDRNTEHLLDAMDLDHIPLDLSMGFDVMEDTVLDTVEIGSSTPPENERSLINNDACAIPSAAAGAGPLPASFGTQALGLHGGGSTLTEFTKRRNWSQRVLEELRDLLYILTPDHRILYLSPSCKFLTGYEPAELLGRSFADQLHPDDSGLYVREIAESISTGNRLRLFHRFRQSDGAYVIFESQGHPHFATEASTPYSSDERSPLCRGIFMMARPYPTKNTALLDSFLEHKIENERLGRRIADLKREETEELDSQLRDRSQKQFGPDSITPSESRESETAGSASYSGGKTGEPSYCNMAPPGKPAVSNTALTQQNLDEANAGSRPDSITDKMARYEGASHIEGIEMLTGLRYGDGERSQGISTGDTSAVLIRGDAGIVIPVDKDGIRTGGQAHSTGADKKKKLKMADEYVCTDCGTLDSPEWRKGPSGPKTLCNACGLRWAKKEKKKSSSGAPVTGLLPGGPMMEG